MAVIPVRKTPKRAFDPHRRPSQLLKDQLTHLEWAARPASERKPGDFRPRMPRTEAEAATRIAKLTRLILARGAAPGAAAVSPAADRPAPASKKERARKAPAGRRGRVARVRARRRR